MQHTKHTNSLFFRGGFSWQFSFALHVHQPQFHMKEDVVNHEIYPAKATITIPLLLRIVTLFAVGMPVNLGTGT